MVTLRWTFLPVFLCGACAFGGTSDKSARLWIPTVLSKPQLPTGFTSSVNPIDAFVAEPYREKGLMPAPPADKVTLLRRVYLDLTGIPPTVTEQNTFENDVSSDAYEMVVDKLPARERHGVRYRRHWVDVLCYTAAEERMIAALGIYLWRDWVIPSLNDDVPYDQFARPQLTPPGLCFVCKVKNGT